MADNNNQQHFPLTQDPSAKDRPNPDGTPFFYTRSNPPTASQPRSPGNFNLDSDSKNSVKGATGGAGVGEEKDELNLVNQVIQIDKQKCRVKGRLFCNGEELYALESDKPLRGYDGRCPKCHKIHVIFDRPNRGFYASVKSIHDTIYNVQLSDQRSKGPKTIDKLSIVKDNLPPLDHSILGENKGIEGDSNSCYMDATIFCMFAYSGVFDSLLHMGVHNKESLENLQKLLRENIVNVLRSKTGFVERDALFYLRDQLSEATGDRSFKEMEKDPSEFLRALENLFPYAPLKTIPPNQPPNANGSNVTTNIMWEMFDANPHKLHSTNIASIFRNSLSEIPAKLATIPPFLILVAPRHARSERSYRYIIPDREIILDSKVVQLVCLKCGQTNHDTNQSCDFYFCNACYLKEASSSSIPSTDAAIICYCSGCLKNFHAKLPEKERCEHDLNNMKTATYKFNLFAVLCIEKCHYVAFVKCHKTAQEHEWIFFDSMSDRIHNEKNVPCVSRASNFDRWIDEVEKDEQFFEDLDRRLGQGKPTSQAFSEDQMRQIRLFRDGAFFFYENSAVNYQ